METLVQDLGQHLFRASWQAALCALAVLLLTRAVPRLSPALRAGLWWFVSLKAVVDLVGLSAGVSPLALPLLPPEATAPVAAELRAVAAEAPPAPAPEGPVLAGVPVVTASEGQGLNPALTGARLPAPVERVALPASAAPLERSAPVPLAQRLAPLARPLLLGAWLLGVALHLGALARGWGQVRRVRQGARPLEDARLQEDAARLAAELGLAPPRLQVARGVQSPLAVGLLRPAVILPPRLLAGLSAHEQRMALAHELAHLRRRDLWLGWVPALAQALFFFHPLVRRAGREYALAREEACDAEALQATGAAPAEYGRLLLAFGVARPHGALTALGASAHLQALKRRLHMLEYAELGAQQLRRWTKVALCGVGLVVLLPFQVVARQAEAPPAPPAPAAPKARAPIPPAPPAPPTARAPAVPPVPPAPRVARAAAPVPPVPPVAPVAPVPPVPPVPPMGARHGTFHFNGSFNDTEEDAYALVNGNNWNMHGDGGDMRAVKRLQKKVSGEFMYVRRGDTHYLIRDAATLKAARAAFEPQQRLGDQQGELGKKQGALGMQQGELGKKQAALGLRQAEIALEHAKLAQQFADRDDDAAEREQEKLEREVEKKQEALEREQEALSQQQEALGRQQEALGEQQEKLGEQQEKLGEESERKLQALLDAAISGGKAEQVQP